MIKKDIRMETEKGAVVYRGKGMYFWQCTSKPITLDIKRTANTKQIQSKYKGASGICGSQNKVQFLATIVSNVSTIIYRRKCNGTFKTGRAFLITLSPEKHKKIQTQS